MIAVTFNTARTQRSKRHQKRVLALLTPLSTAPGPGMHLETEEATPHSYAPSSLACLVFDGEDVCSAHQI